MNNHNIFFLIFLLQITDPNDSKDIMSILKVCFVYAF